MSDDPYLYPASAILRNRLDLRSQVQLDRAERRLVTQRMLEALPGGNFDLLHLRRIHRHLFQDVYEWAGEIRTVELAKGDTRFLPRRFIEAGFADIHNRLVRSSGLKGSTPERFAQEAGTILSDVNHVHPFREGNGRAQLQYLKLLARDAGHAIDLGKLAGSQWIAASKAAHHGHYDEMACCIADALE